MSGGLPAMERPGFAAALAAMVSGKAAVFLIAKRDRLARDVVEAAVATRLIEKQGARIRSADGVTHEDTPEGKLLRTMIDAFAEYERALIRSRTKAALTRLRRDGRRYCRRAPYGFKFTAAGAMVAEPNEQRALKRMRALRRRGLTYQAIADALLKEGRAPREAARWNLMVLHGLLAHRAA